MPLPEPEETEKPAPLFRRIAEDLRQRVSQGIWQADEALPSRGQLCEEFGTTRVTLDKAIQELVRAGVLHSARGVGTFVARPAPERAAPKAAPRSLRLGVVMERTTLKTVPEDTWSDNFYFGPLFQGLRDGVAGEAVDMVYAHLPREEYQEFYHTSEIDGLLLIAPSREELPMLHELTGKAIPYIAVGLSSTAPEDALLACADTDNVRGAAEAMRHLLGLGHRRIALINLATAHGNHYDRLLGYRRAMETAGAPIFPEDLVLCPTYEYQGFEDRIEDWVIGAKSSGNLPTAIFASDYLMALTTLKVLRRHGLRVPEDISLVSFDDPLSAAHLTPALTTVRQPVYPLGPTRRPATASRLAGRFASARRRNPADGTHHSRFHPPPPCGFDPRKGIGYIMTLLRAPQRPTGQRRLGRGFTLIELLVVIAIIAILAAILFPVFQKVRENARRASCASNIRQLTLGLTQYCQDSDEKFPQWNWGNSWSGATNDTTTLWANAIYPFVKSAGVYKCPDDSNSSVSRSWGLGGGNPWFSGDDTLGVTAKGINPALTHSLVSYGGNEAVFNNAPALADTDSPSDTFIVADCTSMLSAEDGYGDWQALKAAGNPQNDPRQQERIVRVAYPNGTNDILYKTDAAKGPFQASFDTYARHAATGNNIGFEDGHTKFMRTDQTTIHLYGVTK